MDKLRSPIATVIIAQEENPVGRFRAYTYVLNKMLKVLNS